MCRVEKLVEVRVLNSFFFFFSFFCQTEGIHHNVVVILGNVQFKALQAEWNPPIHE